MSSLITNPASQFINPYFGSIAENATIYVGLSNTDAMNPDNRQDVYLMQLANEAGGFTKVPLPQPLKTNSAGVIVYEGMPVTPWVDGAYSITIIGYDGSTFYTSFYVDDPTYWLRLDLATEPARTPDGLHYDHADIHGVHMVAGAAPILSPEFEGEPRAVTPPPKDSSTRLATTEFVSNEVGKVESTGVVGTSAWWNSSTPPLNAVVEDGSQLLKDSYPDLYAIIGDQVALANGLVPDSASFFVPDMRGRYVRGVDNGAGRSQYASLFVYYQDMFRTHSHNAFAGNWAADGNNSGGNEGLYGTGNDIPLPTDAAGGAETMPMTVPKLPIIWAVKASQAVSTWWAEPQYAFSRPYVHLVNPETGEHVTSVLARPSPREPGVWLTPAHATQATPPEPVQGTVTVFRNGSWMQDANLYLQRKQQQEQRVVIAKQQREKTNQQLMEQGKKRALMNKWFKENGAPYQLEDLGL
jgi:hypothetical protein